MKLLKALNPVILAPLTLMACATIWLDPIHQVGPDTYQITHTMGTYSPTKGVRKGIIERAQGKCSNQGAGYEKLREEMTPGGTLSYTLTFKCNPDRPREPKTQNTKIKH